MEERHQTLDLAIRHVPMFQIQPDAVVAEMRGVTDKLRKVVPQAGKFRWLRVTPLFKGLASPHVSCLAGCLDLETVPHIVAFAELEYSGQEPRPW